ncbi:reverse transcriptase domain-containing protein [Tanacetum coccineum]
MFEWNINWTRLCSDVVAFACVTLSLLLEALGVCNIRVATPRAVVYAGLMTSEDARSWTDGRTGRGGGRTRGQFGDQSDGRIDGQGGQVGGQGREVNDGVKGVPDYSTIIVQQLQNLLPTIVPQVGNQGRGQGNGRNQKDDAVNDNIRGDVRNVIENKDRRGCTYKEFLACNPKEYDGKGGAIVYTRWIEKMESVQDITTEPKTIQKAMQIADTLTDEALRNGSIKKNHEKRGNGGEPSKDRNVKDDNKRTRTRNAFAITTNPVERENTGTVPKLVPRNVNHIIARNPTVRACYECGSNDHIKSACPRLNRAQGPGGNRPNQALANNGGQGHGNQGNQARGRAFMLEAEESANKDALCGCFNYDRIIVSRS